MPNNNPTHLSVLNRTPPAFTVRLRTPNEARHWVVLGSPGLWCAAGQRGTHPVHGSIKRAITHRPVGIQDLPYHTIPYHTGRVGPLVPPRGRIPTDQHRLQGAARVVRGYGYGGRSARYARFCGLNATKHGPNGPYHLPRVPCKCRHPYGPL